MDGHVLPDLLAPRLRLVICGSAASDASAARGAYYAGPGNRFWKTLYEVGLTPRQFRPEDYPSLLDYGIGLTDVAKAMHGIDRNIPQGAYRPEAVRQKILRDQPQWLALHGKRAAQAFLGRAAEYGVQTETIAATRVFVVPSTSGAARGFFDIAPWHELARAVRL